jgi:cbb3-type cytochrome c oxidase subunit III
VRRLGSDRRTGSARLAAAAALVAALAVAGCNKDTGDISRGQALFTNRCSQCHVIAGSGGVIGPSLDDAFAAARADGMDSDTIAGVVKAQVESPRPSTNNPSVSMPSDLASGQDLDDIAAYVGAVAGTGNKPPKLTPEQIFSSQGCAGCHTLAAAGSAGTTGPNLDQALADMTKQQIQTSITDPGAKIAPGYSNLMPPNFGTTIKPDDLTALVNYLYDNTHKGGK